MRFTNSGQGEATRTFRVATRLVEDWEGFFVVRRLTEVHDPEQSEEPLSAPDWQEKLHPAIWAKTAMVGRWAITLKPGEASWHPLICHMIDVAMVALRLWQYLLPPIVKAQMQASLGLGQQEHAGRWIAFFVGLHDLGKATPGFAFKWADGAERLQAEGFKPAGVSKVAPHGFISAYRIGRLLPEFGLSRANAVAVGRAVGGHHGLFPDPISMERAEENQGGARWLKAQQDLMNVLAHVLGIDQLPVPNGDLLSDSSFLIRLAGLTSVADWIGSNHDYFPFAGDQVRLPQYPRRARWQAVKALIDLGWFHRPERPEPLPFNELFDFTPNHLQAQVEAIANELDGPSLVLLEYPMGGGKTEAALYLANVLQARRGQQGFYVALPTMATSNQMFTRVSHYLANCYRSRQINVQLLHSRADLNPNFARLLRRGQGLPETPLIGDGQDPGENLLAAEWFTHKKQALLAPFGIGTVDQALLAALDTKHYFVRLFGLAGKVVVVDEIHAYDTYMQSLLGHLLTWLAACGSSVILLSATLPSRTRSELLAAYARGLGMPPKAELPEVPYPRITWLCSASVGVQSVDGVPRRRVYLRSFSGTDSTWMVALQEKLVAGGCAAVLCNTVGRAQQTYQALLAYFSPDELLLFHARYPFDDRLRLEKAVLDQFGKGSGGRPHRMVCVATQVIEQSLDIDFDLMVTELAPVDLILQRSGRVWRHERPNRPAHFTEPEVWLLLPPVSHDEVPEFDRSQTFIYDPHLLLRSYLVLKDLTGLAIPEGVEELIESVYQPGDPPEDASPALVAYWRRTSQHMFQSDLGKRRQAAIREIPDLDVQLIDYDPVGLADDLEEIHVAHQAMTRLGGPSVDVVCLYDRDGEAYLTLDAEQPFDLSNKPDPENVLALLGRSVRLSFNPSLVKQILALPVPPSWEVTAHLRKHRLLRFAPDGTCLTADLPLVLDPTLGLRQRSVETEVDT